MAYFDKDKYLPVQDRILRFWQENPKGAITTEVVFTPDYDHVIVKATVYKAKGDLADATGIAAEERGASRNDGANFTNWHENCETSAIGRALANMGYATSAEDRPSREEMTKAERLSQQLTPTNQTQERPRQEPHHAVTGRPGPEGVPMATDRQYSFLKRLGEERGMNEDMLQDTVRERTGFAWGEVPRREMSTFIDWLQGQPPF